MTLGRDRALEMLRGVVRRAEADQVEVLLLGTQVGLTRFANSAVHQNVVERNVKVFVRVVRGKRIGVAATNDLSREGLVRAARSAEEIARRQPENPAFRSLPGPHAARRVETFYPETARLGPRGRAAALRPLFRRAGRAGCQVAGVLATGAEEMAVMNSLGSERYQPLTTARGNVVVFDGESSGFAGALARDIQRFDLAALGERALEKCLLGRKPREIAPGRYTVLLEPTAVAELVEWMTYIAFGSKGIEEGTSFLAGRAGRRIMGEAVTLYDDGLDRRGLPLPFDSEGVPKKRVVFVDRGIARGGVYDTLSAARAGKRSTGHALLPTSPDGALPLNVIMKGGRSTQAQMVGAIERGLWVTRLHYVNGLLDPRRALMTGMTRDGTFWVEDGKVVHAVPSLRFTESMLEAFSRIRLLSREIQAVPAWWSEWGAYLVPSLLIDGFRFTGATGEG